MMNSELSPAVARKLDDFRSRRQRLIISRGICAGLFSVMVALTVVALFDWILFLPELVRWVLSGIAYVTVAAVVWHTCIRLIWKIPDAPQMARLIETAAPSLREDLVSAVELGDPNSEKPWHSTAFRRFLQENVAEKMNEVNVQSLLPWYLIHRWVNVAVVATILFLILLSIPGLHFGQRVTRALLPMADVERVSLTQIEILSPNPANVAVAQGDEIEILVRIGGPGKDDDVTLETSTEGGETSQTPMIVVEGGQRSFKSTVRVGRESVRYRIWANDARTDEHLLLSRQRPQVTSFQKTYRYPAYLQQPERTQTDKTGDLAAVEGTEVDLVVEVSQPVSLAHLMIESAAGSQTLPMSPEINNDGKLSNRMRTTVPLTATGIYRIRLVAAESGLENKFSPEYVIQAESDKPPTIRIDEPPLAILVPSDEIVAMVAAAEDDWGLEKIEQHVRIGDGDWTQATVIDSPSAAANLQVELPWDIHPLNLQPGSVVFTKLVAIDRNGSRGESQMIRAVISSHDFDPRRWSGLGDARSVHDRLVELEQSAAQLREATLAANDPPSLLTAVAAADDYDEKANAALAAIHTAVRSSQAGRESIDLVLVGQAVSQASTVGVGFVRKHLAGGDLAEAGKASDFVVSRVGLASQSFDHLLRLSETSAVTSDLLALRKMYREAMDRADAAAAERISRRMAAIGSESGVIADSVAAMAQHADEAEKFVLRAVENDLRKLKEIGDPLAAPPSGLDTYRQADGTLQTALANSMSLFRDGLLASVVPRKQLIQAAGYSDEPTFRAARYARQLHEMKELLGAQAARGELDRIGEDAEETKRTRELSVAALDAAVECLMTLAGLEQKRPDTDAGFVADTSRGWRAVEAIGARFLAGGDQESAAIDDLDQIARAIEVVNIVHQTDDLIAIVTGVHTRDARPRQELADVDLAAEAMFCPSDWFCAESQYESLASRLQKSNLSPAALELIDQSRRSNDYGLVRKEMVARPDLGRPIETKPVQLTRLLADLKRVRAMLQPELDAARQSIHDLSPRIEQLFAELARQVRDEADQTEELLENAATEQEIQEMVDEQEDETEQLAEQLEEIRDALREDAAEQDVMQEEGRQRMRDDDDALAMLDEQPAAIDEALRQADQAQDLQQQRDALAEAAQRQAELAEQLQQLAEHFANLEEGDPAETREILRQAEENLGIREQLDAQDRQLRELAELADLTPEEALAALEEELDRNQPMQRELDQMTRQQLEQTQAQLEAAAQQQRQIAEDAAQQADSLRQWSEQLSQVGRDANQLAESQVAQAEQALQQQQQAADDNRDNVQQGDDEAVTGDDEAVTGDDEAALDAEAIQRAAEAIEQAQQQLAQASQRAQADAAPSVSQLAEAANDVAQSLRRASEQLNQVGEQSVNEATPDDPPAEDQPGNARSTPIQQAAQQAGDRAEQLAERAEQLAADIQQATDQESAESTVNDPGEVREDSQQQRVAETVQEAEQELQQATRNQQRLGNEENAEQLSRIAEATQRAVGLIEQTAPQADAAQPADVADDPSLHAPRSNEDEQLRAIEEAIREPAQQLDDFLAGEDLAEPGANEPAPSEPGASEPGASEPGASEPGATEPGATEPGATEPGATEPGASEPGQSEPGASEPGQSEPGASEPGASEPGASEPGASEPGASEPGASEPGASEPGQSEPGASAPGSPAAADGPSREPTLLSRSAARELAQALTMLDQQLFGQPPASSSPAATSPSASNPGREPIASSGESTASDPGAAAESSTGEAASSGPAGESGPASGEGEPAEGNGDPTPGAANPAAGEIAAAAQAQSREIAAQRSSGSPNSLAGPAGPPQPRSSSPAGRPSPSSSPLGQGFAEISGGASIDGGPVSVGVLPPIGEMTQADWAKLPPKVARDLLDGRREQISPEYRRAVETYFRLIAEKSREK